MSWESTALYYRQINQEVKKRLGGLHSARLAMVSVDFEEIEVLQRRDEWDRAGELLGAAARRIEAAGADFLLICTNTMHKVAPQVQAAIDIPLLHIADATAKRIKAEGSRPSACWGPTSPWRRIFTPDGWNPATDCAS